MPREDARVVLAVDDDPAILSMLVRTLGTIYTVYVAENAIVAGELLQKIPSPDVLVLDVGMPQLDGLAFARQLKAEPKLRSIPIIFLTARTTAVDVVQGINAGARHYLTKPFALKDLLDKVAQVIAKSGPAHR